MEGNPYSALKNHYSSVSAKALNISSRLVLANNLDYQQVLLSEKNYARDYRGLAELTGLPYCVFKKIEESENRTIKILESWETRPDATIDKLISYLEDMDRHDVIEELIPSLKKNVEAYLEYQKSQEIPIQVPEVTSGPISVYSRRSVLTRDDLRNKDEAVSIVAEFARFLESTSVGLKLFIRDRDMLAGCSELDTNIEMIKNRIEPVDLAYNCIKAEESQDKSPILLIHGLGGSSRNWIGVDLLLSLRTKRTVCAVDLRNHGDSPWNNRVDVAALAVDIGHFLDTHKIKTVNIIGHSLGGKTAIHYTLNNPDRVDSVIVEDSRPNYVTPEAFSQVKFFVTLLKDSLISIPAGATEDTARNSIADYISMRLKQLGSSERLPDNIGTLIELKLVDGKWRFKLNVEILDEALKDPQSLLTESSGLYEGPALFIYGTESPYKVSEDKDIPKLFPKAQLVPVNGAGHFIHGVFREFDDAVIRFLNKEN